MTKVELSYYTQLNNVLNVFRSCSTMFFVDLVVFIAIKEEILIGADNPVLDQNPNIYETTSRISVASSR